MIVHRLLPRPHRALYGLFAMLLGLLLPWAAQARADADFLEPEQAFPLTARAVAPDAVELHFAIADGYYLYREKLHAEAAQATLGVLQLPPGHVKHDETFNKDVETYRGELVVRVPVQRATGPFTLDVTSQGCADAGLCYPPLTRHLQVALTGFGGDGSVQPQEEHATSSVLPGGGRLEAQSPAASSPAASGAGGLSRWTDGQTADRVLRGGSWWSIIGAFSLMGLLLSFTPCVLPMLPILSSVIAGGGDVSRRRGLALAVAYSAGMAFVYTALGVAAGLAGEGLAAQLQKPLVLIAFAALLLVFALAMFDVYELRLPHALANHLHGASTRLPGGRFAGVFLMGGLSALIVSPCVSAPLAGALVFLSQTRDVTLAGSALFAMACGMSVPLLALGASAGAWLPRSGSWMHAVKHFFGMLLVGTALYLVQPVLPAWGVLLGWGAWLLVAGFMLRPFDAHPHPGAPRVWLQRGAGVAALALGVMQLAGAASGARDPLQPLSRLSAGQSPQEARSDFRVIHSGAELDAALQAAAGRPLMLDFYADWCVSCKEMDRLTYSDPAVHQRLAGAVLLKADVTANTPDERALLQRFSLFGPPGTIFFDVHGQQRTERVVGYQNPEQFLGALTAAGL